MTPFFFHLAPSSQAFSHVAKPLVTAQEGVMETYSSGHFSWSFSL
jgi:hypothetical protein